MDNQKTVLIVEDEKNIVDIVKFNLMREGYRTIEAYDGEDGLNKARTENPDLILLDVMLPKMIGFDVCKTLRSEVSSFSFESPLNCVRSISVTGFIVGNEGAVAVGSVLSGFDVCPAGVLFICIVASGSEISFLLSLQAPIHINKLTATNNITKVIN